MESRSAAEAAGRAAAGKGTQGGSKDPRAVDRIAQTMNNANVETHQLKDWADASREYNDRSFGRRALDFVAGPWFNDNKPDFNDPRTFWGGKFHTSTNPLGAAASLLGGAAFPGAGIPAGMIGSAIGPEAYHKQMDPNSPLAHEIASTKPLDGSAPINTAQGQFSAPQGHGTQGGTIPGPIKPPMPSIMNPQAPQQAAMAAQQPTIFRQPTQSRFQVAGGSPYGFNIFGRAA